MHAVELNESSLNKVIGYLNWINQMPVDLRENADFDALEASIFDGGYCLDAVLDAINDTGVLEYQIEDYLYYPHVDEDGRRLFVTVDLGDKKEARFVLVPV